MAWLIGIGLLIVAMHFWRATLWTLGALFVGGTLLYVYFDEQEKSRERARLETSQRIQQAIVAARRSGTAKHWALREEADPASGEPVPRIAFVRSDDDLCSLQIEQRIDGSRLAGIYCGELRVEAHREIDVKFDTRTTSDRMRINRFSNGHAVYIPSHQSEYGGRLAYEEFLRRLSTARKVSLHLTFVGAGSHWITFSLDDSREALIRIGAVLPPIVRNSNLTATLIAS